MKIFDEKTHRYTVEGLNLLCEDERKVAEAFKNLVKLGISPRDVFVALSGVLQEEMCSAVIWSDGV